VAAPAGIGHAAGVARPSPGAPVPARPRISIVPLMVYSYNGELKTSARRTVGHRLTCSCGYRGPVRTTVAAARGDRPAHELEHDGAGARRRS
jgi:hypothetical protein